MLTKGYGLKFLTGFPNYFYKKQSIDINKLLIVIGTVINIIHMP